jgi:hypothetical protein
MTAEYETHAKITGQIVTKLGRAKGKARSRIWIEGPRLEQIGFVPGARYDMTTMNAGRSLLLELSTDGAGARKVSGKAHSGPIIDITGARVFAMFGHAETVLATFCDDGTIFIDTTERGW